MDATSGEIWNLLPPALTGLICMGYAVFIFVKGGTHLRGKGWHTKKEAPKSYYFMLFLMLLIGLSSIIFTAIRAFQIFNN
ncbi:MAG TPA: hypothetical protein EYQ85_00360 [Candidatus Poseidoniales archaeon]|jgi:hypothetical protein|nr:MAG: hypothetical protein CXT68_05440 [Euryarchaeota archaeon]HIF15696.1 hypothetical protein [Candidatus Poseidoniales archaeon]